jgi:hypothetical protein
MQIIDCDIFTRYTVSLRVDGIEDRLKPEYTQGEFRPTNVNLGWLFQDGAWRFVNCTVAGPKIKKDGTDSQLWSDRKYVGWNKELLEKPTWLVELVDRYAATLPAVSA